MFRRITLVSHFYKQAVENKDGILKTTKNDKIKIALVVILSIATIVWMACSIGCCFESIMGNYKLYSDVHDCAICRDGWVSHSFGPGTCSQHGGVDYYKYIKEQVGTHIAEPEKYYSIIAVSLIIIIVPSILSSLYRTIAISFQLTGLYYTGCILITLCNIVIFPILILIRFNPFKNKSLSER